MALGKMLDVAAGWELMESLKEKEDAQCERSYLPV